MAADSAVVEGCCNLASCVCCAVLLLPAGCWFGERRKINATPSTVAATDPANPKAGERNQSFHLLRGMAITATAMGTSACGDSAAIAVSVMVNATTSRHSLHRERCCSVRSRSGEGNSSSTYAFSVSGSGCCSVRSSVARSLWRSNVDNSGMASQNPYLLGTQAGDFLAAFWPRPAADIARQFPVLLPPGHVSFLAPSGWQVLVF